MTAEIAILNKTAVALAADSAITYQSEHPKIYQSVNKLFEISEKYPVGVMIYGNAEFLNVPWETVIKSYKKIHGDKSFDSLEEYANDFLKFIEDSRWLFPHECQVENFKIWLNFHYKSLQKIIDNEIEKEFNNNNKLYEKDIKKIIREKSKEYLNNIICQEEDNSLPENFSRNLQDEFQSVIEETIKEVFVDSPLTKTARKYLYQIAGYLPFCKKVLNDNYSSGIVVSGFGELDIYPKSVSYELKGLWLNNLIYKTEKYGKIENDNNAIIQPFAQTEMVHMFMEGIDPNYNQLLHTYIENLIKEIPNILESYIPESLQSKHKPQKERLKKYCNQIEDYIFHYLEDFRRRNYINPVLEAVSILPKNELAEMAESLVNLTSFKRRMSMQAETVGGAIDVAIISKGDGFIWIKRKHYFDPNFNYRYLAKIFNSITKE